MRDSARRSTGIAVTLAERALVTGAAGFLGSQLVRRLVAERHEVVALVRPQSDLWRLHDVLDRIDVVPTDLSSTVSVGTADVVFHLAAAGVRPGEAARAVVGTNVLGTLTGLEIALEAGARRFVYCGSCFEYGPGEGHREDAPPRPISEYGASKAAGRLLAEAFSRAHGLPVTAVLPFTAYGPYEAAQRLVPSVCLAIVRGDPVELTSGEQTRDLIYVDDVVDGLLAVARADTRGTFNLCTGRATSVQELLAGSSRSRRPTSSSGWARSRAARSSSPRSLVIPGMPSTCWAGGRGRCSTTAFGSPCAGSGSTRTSTGRTRRRRRSDECRVGSAQGACPRARPGLPRHRVRASGVRAGGDAGAGLGPCVRRRRAPAPRRCLTRLLAHDRPLREAVRARSSRRRSASATRCSATRARRRTCSPSRR